VLRHFPKAGACILLACIHTHTYRNTGICVHTYIGTCVRTHLGRTDLSSDRNWEQKCSVKQQLRFLKVWIFNPRNITSNGNDFSLVASQWKRASSGRRQNRWQLQQTWTNCKCLIYICQSSFESSVQTCSVRNPAVRCVTFRYEWAWYLPSTAVTRRCHLWASRCLSTGQQPFSGLCTSSCPFTVTDWLTSLNGHAQNCLLDSCDTRPVIN
jgi:hypothetical protein